MNGGLCVVIFCTLCSMISGSLGHAGGCPVGNRTYAVGETFHPTVSTAAGDREYIAVCTNCTCFNVIPLCQETQCPQLNCEHPVRIDGECCSVCMEPGKTAVPSQCIYDGFLIEHGEVFQPAQLEGADNKTAGIKPHCNECTCMDGVVSCKDLSTECPALKCDADLVETLEGTCCPVCPAPPSMESGPQDCLSSDGRHFANGESWHPLFPLLGPIPCINCTCIDSHEVCHSESLPCPTGPLPPCGPDEPIPDIILCCKTCEPVPSPKPTAPTTTPSLPTLIKPDILPEGHVSTVPCDPSHTVEVWRHLTHDTVAMEFTEGSTGVRIYRWTQSGASYQREEETVTRGEFSDVDYEFIGWTPVRRVNSLTTKKAEKLNSCMENCAFLAVKFLRPTKCQLTS